jgi:aspartate/glutamate racemase
MNKVGIIGGIGPESTITALVWGILTSFWLILG